MPKNRGLLSSTREISKVAGEKGRDGRAGLGRHGESHGEEKPLFLVGRGKSGVLLKVAAHRSPKLTCLCTEKESGGGKGKGSIRIDRETLGLRGSHGRKSPSWLTEVVENKRADDLASNGADPQKKVGKGDVSRLFKGERSRDPTAGTPSQRGEGGKHHPKPTVEKKASPGGIPSYPTKRKKPTLLSAVEGSLSKKPEKRGVTNRINNARTTVQERSQKTLESRLNERNSSEKKRKRLHLFGIIQKLPRKGPLLKSPQDGDASEKTPRKRKKEISA